MCLLVKRVFSQRVSAFTAGWGMKHLMTQSSSFAPSDQLRFAMRVGQPSLLLLD